MPLRALLQEKEIIAPLLSEEEWQELAIQIKAKKAELILPCCNSRGNLRKSKLGTKHFYYLRKQSDSELICNWPNESSEHLQAKTEIVWGCIMAGFEVATEVSGKDQLTGLVKWRADVLASKVLSQQKELKVALEVQWSKQNLQETEFRQTRYKQDGVRACWFFRYLPTELKEARKDLPIFQILANNPEQVSFPNYNYLCFSSEKEQTPKFPLRRFVEDLLSGTNKIKFCQKVSATSIGPNRIIFGEYNCWKCGKVSHIYTVKKANLRSNCGMTVNPNYIDDSKINDLDSFDPKVIQRVRDYLKSPEAHKRGLKVALPKRRWSNTEKKAYMSFGCYWCDAILGDFYLGMELAKLEQAEEQYGIASVEIAEETTNWATVVTAPHKHWCYPTAPELVGNGQFCE